MSLRSKQTVCLLDKDVEANEFNCCFCLSQRECCDIAKQSGKCKVCNLFKYCRPEERGTRR